MSGVRQHPPTEAAGLRPRFEAFLQIRLLRWRQFQQASRGLFELYAGQAIDQELIDIMIESSCHNEHPCRLQSRQLRGLFSLISKILFLTVYSRKSLGATHH